MKKMNINKNNYEAFFLDYHEGNLSPQQVADLLLFLSQYPELKKEFEDFEHIVLEDFSAPVFENKEGLKKNITAANREEYFIRAVENTLDTSELALLDQFLKTHPEFMAEFVLFRKTKLETDQTIAFEDKPHLKQLTETDNYLISALEGLLSAEEQTSFKTRLTNDADLQRSMALYQQTKSLADATVVYANKQSLKRKEKKVIPLYYFIAVAASFILLVGLFFLWRTTNTREETHFAEQKEQPTQNQQKQPVQKKAEMAQVEKKEKMTVPASPLPVVLLVKNKKTSIKKSENQIPLVTETPAQTGSTLDLPAPPLAVTEPEKENEPFPSDSAKQVEKKNTSPAIAKMEKKQEATKALSYTSLRDILASKLKEKLTGKDPLQEESPAHASKKIDGWEIAGVFAKSLSRLTGKRIEVKPEYNEEGNIKSYALSAGKLEFSRVR